MLKLLVIFSLSLVVILALPPQVNLREDPPIEPLADPIVTTAQGQLRGKQSYLGVPGLSSKYEAFKGIPYAEPPTGNLRFRAPVPHAGWVGIRDAQEHGNECAQFGLSGGRTGDEDCLFLNVYTPSLTGKRPVMVWIHGGGFYLGSGNSLMYGPEHLLKEDVVVVTLNYRMGIFGFLSTGDSFAPGNYGMKDMILALEWVKQNIAAFSGDPDNVTLFGESAGSASVHLLVLSPLSAGLFNRAISESGTGLSPWAFQYDPKSVAIKTAQKAGIDTSSSEAMMKGFRAASQEDLVHFPNLAAIPIPRGLQAFPFVPCVDAPDSLEPIFMPQTPLEMIKSGSFNKIPYILGQNSDESLFMARETEIVDHDAINKMNANPNLWIPQTWNVKPNTTQAQEIIDAFRNIYFKGGQIQDLYDYTKFYTDNHFTWPTQQAIQIQSQSQQIYHYVFSFEGAFNYLKRMLLLGSYTGAMHSDELFYLWSISSIADPVLPGSPALTVRNRMISMWTNFAKSGNPTPETNSLITVQWKPVAGQLEHIRIDAEIKTATYPFNDRMQTWRDFNAKYGP